MLRELGERRRQTRPNGTTERDGDDGDGGDDHKLLVHARARELAPSIVLFRISRG